MDRNPDSVTVTLSRHSLEQLQRLLEMGERVGGTQLCPRKNPQGIANAAVDIAAGKLKEFISVQNMVRRAVEDDAIAASGVRRSHTLYRVVVPDEEMNECSDLLDQYAESDPSCPHAARIRQPVTPTAVFCEALETLRSVLSGEYEQLVREKVAQEAREEAPAPSSEPDYRYVHPEQELIH